jgi:cobalt-zinc-cadmium efflux system outer membrane protein
MRARVVRAALVAVLVPLGADAQTLSLTESQALSQLALDSPRARAIRAGVEVARADVLMAARWPNPRVTFDREAVAGVTENIVIVAQPLPITGRRRFEVQAASALVSASSSRADDEMGRLRADLQLAFAELVASQARERELTAARDRLRELADVLAKREAAGEAAGFDRLRAEREVLDIDADRTAAATERARAQAMLASFFNDVADPSRLIAVDQRTPAASVPPLEGLIERAESTRGELLALRHEAEAARLAEQAAARRRIPEPEVVGGTKSSTAAGGDIGSVVAVHAAIPLFDRGRPEQALAIARAHQADARALAFRQVLRGRIAALRGVVVERREAAERYRAQTVANADQIERIAQVSYDAGERSILELLDAYRVGSTARVRQATLDASVRQAEIELGYTSGWEIQ